MNIGNKNNNLQIKNIINIKYIPNAIILSSKKMKLNINIINYKY